MRFLTLFRINEQKLGDALLEVHTIVFDAAKKALDGQYNRPQRIATCSATRAELEERR